MHAYIDLSAPIPLRYERIERLIGYMQVRSLRCGPIFGIIY